jgi:hypothetical protein
MGQLALGVAGAVVGSFFGAPGLGFAIGAGIGGAVFNKSGNTVREGARLGDQTITASTYGNPIPICYGAPGWLHGNVLWQKGVREVRTEETEGGKGGSPKTTTVTYTYFNSFAVGFAEGEAASLLRIKIDEKLVYDVSNKALGQSPGLFGILSQKNGINFRFYIGDEEQLPDPLIVADKGDLAPAHRGMVYIMFDNLPLENYGNRAIPQVQVDIAFKYAPPEFPNTDLTTSVNSNMNLGSSTVQFLLTKDFSKVVASHQHGSGGGTLSLSRYSAIDPTISAEYLVHNASNTNSLEIPQHSDLDDEGNIYFASKTGTSGRAVIRKYDGNTGLLLDQASGLLDGFQSFTTYRTAVGSYPTVDGDNLYHNVIVVYGHYTNTPANSKRARIIDGNQITPVPTPTDNYFPVSIDFLLNAFAPHNESNSPIDIVQENHVPGKVRFKVITLGFDSTAPNNQWFNLYRLEVDIAKLKANALDPSLVSRYLVTTISLNFLKDYGINFVDDADILSVSGGSGFVMVDPATNDCIISFRKQDEGPTHLMRINQSGLVLWRTTFDDGTGYSAIFRSSDNVLKPYKYGIPGNFLWLIIKNKVGYLDLLSGALTENLEDLSGNDKLSATESRRQYYIPSTRCIIYASLVEARKIAQNGIHRTCLISTGIIEIDQISDNLANIVRNISNRVGHENSDVDVSELVPIPVPGFRISQGQARTPIEQLMSIYQFDIVESDYVLKAVLRGQSPVLNIPEDDLIIIEESTGEVVRERRIQEVELPEEVTIGYIEWEQEYVPGLQRAKRILNPVPTMYSRNKLSLEVPIMEEGTFMKRVVEKILYSTWLGRSIYEFTSSWKYLRLDPTDVVTITLGSGTVFQARLTNNSIDGNLALTFEAVSDEAASYTSSNTEADVGSGAIGQLIVSVPPSYAFLFNVPLLRDLDDNGRLFLRQYFALAPKITISTSLWSGAMLLKSLDNVLYGQVAQSNSPVTWGLTMDALPSVEYWNQTDTVNTLTVKMESGGGELSSVSQLQMLNGSNPALLISDDGGVEVIQFRDVEVLDDGVYRFSNLLRGRRGTESFMAGHHAGEKFIFLSPSTVSYISSGLSERNVNRFYRAVSFGTLLEDADVYQFQHKGRDLMPWAPVYVGAEMGYDSVLLTWIRRARINNEANFIIESGLGLPLAEDDESYEVDILDGPSGNVLRTIATIGNPSIVYPDSQIITDFGSMPPEINVNVYQMSGQVGRGFTIEQVAQTGSYINLEAESTTLFNELPGSPSDFHKEIMNILISDLKAAGVWTKIRLLYVFATYNQQASLLNWKAPATAADILVPNGSPDFSIEEGWQAQADGDRLNLATAWNAIGTYVQNSAHLGTFNLTDSLTNGAEVGRGFVSSGTNNPILRSRKGDGNFGVLINGAEVLAAVPSSLGHFVGNRSGSTAVQLYKDGLSVGTGSTTSASVSNLTVQFLSHAQNTGYSDRRVSIVHAGSSLTAAEVALINTAFKRYMKFIT